MLSYFGVLQSVITDGWVNIVRDLRLTKNTLLLLRITEEKSIEIDCFVENVCGESFLTVNRYGVLKIVVSIIICLDRYLFCYTCQLNDIIIYLTVKCSITFPVIPEAYIRNYYSYSRVNDCYNIYATGQSWKVETNKINDNYVFTKGCPMLFDDLAIEEEDILLLMMMDNVTFELRIYRKGVEVVLRKKEEIEDDSLVEIPKQTYYENVNFVSNLN
ncbi:putative DNA-binding pseudobarrel domain superfamily [Helianthus anomalus]